LDFSTFQLTSRIDAIEGFYQLLLDHKDIFGVSSSLLGKHWRTFNSDKICDITYARTKAGGHVEAIREFRTMEKDDEYNKPLCFISGDLRRASAFLPFDPTTPRQARARYISSRLQIRSAEILHFCIFLLATQL
jgi:hypothetical protein